jgi:hypothetical protein
MTPSPLTPAEMHTAALSVLERVELLGELVARGQDPELRGIAGALDAALALHREIAHALDDVDLDPDGEDVHELRETLARVGDTLEIVIRTIDLLAMTREVAAATPIGPDGARG